MHHPKSEEEHNDDLRYK